MDIARRQTNPKAPTNKIASRGLIRDLARTIGIGTDITNISSKEFSDQYDKFLQREKFSYNPSNIVVPRNTFKRWVHGDSFPQAQWTRTFFNYLPQVKNRWVLRKNFRCRLQRYLASLDLKWMKIEKNEYDASNGLAEQIIREIHQDWRLDSAADIALKGPFEKDPFGCPHIPIFRKLYEEIGIFPEDTKFGLELNHRSFIYPRIKYQALSIHQPDSKMSVIPHMLWIAMNLNSDGPNIHLALILDLLSALHAAEHLNYYRIERNLMPGFHKETLSEHFGKLTHKLFLSDYHEFNDDDHGASVFGERCNYNSLQFEFNEISKPKIEENINLDIPDEAFSNLWRLKLLFYQTLSLMTGMSIHDVLQEIKSTYDYIDTTPYVIKLGGAEFLDQ